MLEIVIKYDEAHPQVHASDKFAQSQQTPPEAFPKIIDINQAGVVPATVIVLSVPLTHT